MPIMLENTAETDGIVDEYGWIHDCREATWRDLQMVRVTGMLGGSHLDAYLRHDGVGVRSSIDAAHFGNQGLDTAGAFDAAAEILAALDHVENIRVVPYGTGRLVEWSCTLPGVGDVDLASCAAPLDQTLRTLAKHRQQDAEGRTTTTLGAMILALPARDTEEVDRIVDTIFHGGTTRYRGVVAAVDGQGRITVAHNHQGVAMRSDGIEIPDLPETVQAAIKGKARRRLRDIVNIPGFHNLDVVRIGANAKSSGMAPGRGWIRLDVRDEDGATFRLAEKEEARAIAHATFTRRTS